MESINAIGYSLRSAGAIHGETQGEDQILRLIVVEPRGYGPGKITRVFGEGC